MGVPKLFAYITRTYPNCVSELDKNKEPNFDNLYLDMNGVIHDCVKDAKCDADIFANITRYIQVLFDYIKPRKLLFLAIDGVAPRAKLNQQRARRFLSAKEKRNENFDSNCITPGTLFMANLQEHLRHFIRKQINNDELWGKCTIILSGHQNPGEGEHKIMAYIRHMKKQPEYDPEISHCFYGLDADLINLGLCAKEKKFYILREEVIFGPKRRQNLKPEEKGFLFIDISCLRHDLEQTFKDLEDKISFEFDLTRIIDDWILICFFLGNDFIPSIPKLLIKCEGVEILQNAYKLVLPTLNGYLHEKGKLNLERLHSFLGYISEGQLSKSNSKKFKKERRNKSKNTTNQQNENKILDLDSFVKSQIHGKHYLKMWKQQQGYGEMSNDNTKFNEATKTKYVQSIVNDYIKTIQWIAEYYFNSLCSWKWYYPHHYAPYISDIKFTGDISFDYGGPLLPFQQLLAVLPPSSKSLLPMCYQELMTSEKSPIIGYYVEEFKTEGSKVSGVVLLPFINEDKLLEAMESYNGLLNEEEINRNIHKPMMIYEKKEENTYELPL